VLKKRLSNIYNTKNQIDSYLADFSVISVLYAKKEGGAYGGCGNVATKYKLIHEVSVNQPFESFTLHSSICQFYLSFYF
jgi:hypothetical protein